MRLTAIVLTFNEEKHIADCVESLQFAHSVIVFDSFSTDDTCQIARSVGADVIQHAFENYPSQRNAALDAVRKTTDWVLFVDADERISKALAEEVLEKIQFPGYGGFRIPRHNYIFGRLTRGAGWYPDYQTRLLKVDSAHYVPERQVHEVVELMGDQGTLVNPIIHYNYETIQQFLVKQRKYTAYEAKILFEEGVRPKLRNYILQPLRHFRWRFMTLKGYTDGVHGLLLSGLMAYFEFKKYRYLRELWYEADWRSKNEAQG